MNKKFHFVYLTTNLVNGKQYVGDHSTNNLNDAYLGTGKLIKLAVKKYGRHNFKREILQLCLLKEEAFNIQEKYIKEYNTLVPNGYNLSPKGGSGVNQWFAHSEESKNKLSIKRFGENNPFFNKTHTQETKEIFKQRIPWNKGKKNVYSKETRDLMSNVAKYRIPWNKGLKIKKT